LPTLVSGGLCRSDGACGSSIKAELEFPQAVRPAAKKAKTQAATCDLQCSKTLITPPLSLRCIQRAGFMAATYYRQHKVN
jgi:hypothetical protein